MLSQPILHLCKHLRQLGDLLLKLGDSGALRGQLQTLICDDPVSRSDLLLEFRYATRCFHTDP